MSVLFCLALALVHGHHELWRDEMHCWVVARNAKGFWDILTGIRRYDGHPFLWYYVLYLASRLSRSVVVLHGTTVLIAALSSYLWFRHAPLPRLFRVGLLGTYLFFYEYGVLSRAYALGLLCLFLFCHFYRRGPRQVPLLSLLLVALSLTSAYGAMLAVSLAIVLYLGGLADVFKARQRGQSRFHTAVWVVGGMIIFELGLQMFWLTSSPPDDGFFGIPGILRTSPSWSRLAFYYWSANFPRCNPDNGMWIVHAAMGDNIGVLVPCLPWAGVILFVLWLLAFRKARLVAAAYAAGVLIMAAFQHYYYDGFIRHFGHYFVLLVACLWLYAKQRPEVSETNRPWLLRALLAVTLAVQIVAAVKAVKTEIARPFSGSLQASSFLRAHGLEQGPFVGSFDHAVSVVAGYLDRSFRAAETNEAVTSVVFHKRRWRMAPPPLALGLALLDARTMKKPVILIVNHDVATYPELDPTIERLYTTDPPIVGDEQFTIFRVNPPRAPRADVGAKP